MISVESLQFYTVHDETRSKNITAMNTIKLTKLLTAFDPKKYFVSEGNNALISNRQLLFKRTTTKCEFKDEILLKL